MTSGNVTRGFDESKHVIEGEYRTGLQVNI